MATVTRVCPKGCGQALDLLTIPRGGRPRAALDLGRASVLNGLAIPRTTTELSRQLGVSQGTTSEHLSRLRKAGLVEPHRSGRSVFYRLSREGEQLLELFSERNDGSPRARS